MGRQHVAKPGKLDRRQEPLPLVLRLTLDAAGDVPLSQFPLHGKAQHLRQHGNRAVRPVSRLHGAMQPFNIGVPQVGNLDPAKLRQDVQPQDRAVVPLRGWAAFEQMLRLEPSRQVRNRRCDPLPLLVPNRILPAVNAPDQSFRLSACLRGGPR